MLKTFLLQVPLDIQLTYIAFVNDVWRRRSRCQVLAYSKKLLALRCKCLTRLPEEPKADLLKVSDALLNLNVPSAGVLADIGEQSCRAVNYNMSVTNIANAAPIPTRYGCTNRLVAPISTVLFMPNHHEPGDNYVNYIIPKESNLSKDQHFSDAAAPGTVVLMQQLQGQIAALLGDIVATRYKIRGIKGVFTDGRTRDIVGCGELCKDGKFQAWAKSLTSIGTSTEAKPWAVDVPLQVGKLTVKPGDILCADEAEMVSCVIPREKLGDVLKLLPVQKAADDGLLKDIQNGMSFKEAIVRHPEHYTVRHAKGG